MGRILVTGAAGTIGAKLLPPLQNSGHYVVSLTRGTPKRARQIQWDASKPLDSSIVSGVEAVIHLAGEPIIGRWTEDKKRRIIESRAQGTRHLAEALASAPQRPRVFISASAIGYYGDRGNEILREDSGQGNAFTSEICRQWEDATQPAIDAGIRTVQMRISVVLSKDSGALPKMLTPYRLGLGGKMGSGQQYWSWIHVDDLVAAIQHVMQSDLQGPVNADAPNPVTNAEFTQALAAAVSRPAIFPMPSFVVRLIFGQMGEELWLASQRVQPAKLLESGFRFRYPELRGALQNLLHQ